MKPALGQKHPRFDTLQYSSQNFTWKTSHLEQLKLQTTEPSTSKVTGTQGHNRRHSNRIAYNSYHLNCNRVDKNIALNHRLVIHLWHDSIYDLLIGIAKRENDNTRNYISNLPWIVLMAWFPFTWFARITRTPILKCQREGCQLQHDQALSTTALQRDGHKNVTTFRSPECHKQLLATTLHKGFSPQRYKLKLAVTLRTVSHQDVTKWCIPQRIKGFLTMALQTNAHRNVTNGFSQQLCKMMLATTL